MRSDVALTCDGELARSINQLHQQIVTNDRTMKYIAADIGEMLTQKKTELKHGKFTPWVEQFCDFKEHTARDYMRVSKAKRERALDFEVCASIREVLALGKTKKAPVQETRAATLDDLRKVERLRALRDDPAGLRVRRSLPKGN